MTKAQVRYSKTHITILCELGHVIDYCKLDRSFAGSMFEAELSFRCDGDRWDRLAEKCKGAGHGI